jgi:murein L,D-transpeptidase YcbB/YkuD
MMNMPSLPRWWLVVAGFALTFAQPVTAQLTRVDAVATELKWRVERLRSEGRVEAFDEGIGSDPLTLAVYEQRGFAPLWTDPASLESLLRAVDAVAQDGLDPEDYHRSSLARGLEQPFDTGRRAELDLVATDAFVRLAHDLRYGKVRPEGPAGGTNSWPFGGSDAVDQLVAIVSSGRVVTALYDLRPRHFMYDGLVRALAAYRAIQKRGGWDSIPTGPTMGLDSADMRVPALRGRLVIEGDLRPDEAVGGYVFDPRLEEGVKSFQHRHGLNEDGRVGDVTLAALNVPVERRIDQLRVNLERARWIAHVLPDTLVAVNVAGARVYVLEGDSVVFESRAIVGKDYTKTPVFTAPMRYVDLNPTWTVPPGIVGEVLADIRREPGYLERHSMKVLDAPGHEVDPAGVDFSQYTDSTFPYVFRQEPGPTNPLGRIKLMFPNEHNVYLHDTPTPELFGREERLFSHGCIRVEDPLGLAELVLGEPTTWNRATLREAIDSGAQRTIRLPTPIPVFVLYWTAAVDLQGTIHFSEDVYRRDAGILSALNAGRYGGTGVGLER